MQDVFWYEDFSGRDIVSLYYLIRDDLVLYLLSKMLGNFSHILRYFSLYFVVTADRY